MEQLCHRCSTAVSREDAFCPMCGAPQLHFDASDQLPFGENAEGSVAEGRPGQINWKVALDACAKIAVPAGVLCSLPFVSAGSLIWVLGGATAIILLYRRKRPTATLSAKAGLRIGGLAGLIIAYVSLAVTAITGVVQRFPMHIGQALDDGYEQIIHLSMGQSAAIFQGNPAAQAQMHSMYVYMLTPDGRATYAFMTMVASAILTILLSAVGGVVGVRMFALRRVA